MSGTNISGTYTNPVALTSVAQNPVTVADTGVIDVNTSTSFTSAIYGSNAATWTIANSGTLESFAPQGEGINLNSSGVITNQATGHILGNGSAISINPGGVANVTNYGTIQGYANGIVATTGTITNFNEIAGAGPGSDGVQLGSGGGRVVNGVSGSTAGTISGVAAAVSFAGGTDTVLNYGTLSALAGIGVSAFNNAVVNVDNFGAIVASGTNAAGAALSAGSGVVNHGAIAANGSGAVGVLINGGGSLVNNQGGTISGSQNGVYFGTSTNTGTLTNYGKIAQYGSATFASGLTWNLGGTIRNEGTISQQSTSGEAVNLGTVASTLVNGTSAATNAVISGQAGIGFNGGNDTLVNYGTVKATAATGVNVFNGATAQIINFGTLESVGANRAGISFSSNGVVTNEASGLISGTANGIVSNSGTSTTISNLGVVSQVGSDNFAVTLNAGVVTNGQSGSTAGLITGGGGVNMNAAGGTVTNYGTIQSTATATLNGIHLAKGGIVVNGASGATTALITAYRDGIYIGGTEGTTYPGEAGTITNFGTILSTGTVNTSGRSGIFLVTGGTVTNEAGALIQSAARTAVGLSDIAGDVFNSGTIASLAAASGTAGSGVYLEAGGTIVNQTGGIITADRYAIVLGGTVATNGSAAVANSGDISGAVGVVVTPFDTGTNMIVNYGTITGTGGTAVELAGGPATLVIEPGSDLSGAISGFAVGDTIDFAHKTGDSLSFSNDTLSLINAGTVVGSVILSGPPSANGFTLTSDNAGGTDIRLATAGNELGGSGVSDALMTNSGGAVVLDEVSGGAMTYQQVSAVGPQWQVEGEGALLGDGQDQFLLWYGTDDSPTYGTLVAGEDDGGSIAYTQLGAVGPEWQFEGVGPLAGGSNSDILLWNGDSASSGFGTIIVGAVNDDAGNPTKISWTPIGGVGPEWSFEGVGQFLGDGSTDFLIWDTNSSSASYGAVVVGKDVGGSATFTSVGGLDPTAWKFEGSGDLLSDGKDSVLLWNQSTGALVVGEVNGGALQYTAIGGVGPEWQFLGVGNYDGKSPAEFLMWNGNGTSPSGALVIGTVADGSTTFTQVGGVGPDQWTFHPTNPALLS